MPDQEEILGNRLAGLLTTHRRADDGCTCGAGSAAMWDDEHREHVARVIARELSTNGE